MALSISQFNAGDTGTGAPSSATVTLPGASTNGNVLVMAVSSDAYVSTPPSGWTLNANCSNMTFLGQYVYTKLTGGGESSWNVTPDSAASLAWVVFEVAGADSSAFDVAAAQFAQSFGASYTTADLTPTAGERLLVAAFGGSLSSTSLQGVSGWTNSFTEVADAWSKKTSGTNDTVGVATRVVIADGSTVYNTSVTWDNSVTPQARAAIILSLKGAVGANLAPTANAGSNRTVPANTLVMLSGLGSSDSDGTIASYSWQQLSGTTVALSSGSVATPTFTTPSGDTLLVFGLTVTDNDGAISAQATVDITVNASLVTSAAKIRIAGAWEDKPLYIRSGGMWLN
jgi:hypothetical protein